MEPLSNVFLRADSYSLAFAVGATEASVGSNGPGSFGGPFVSGPQAVAALAGIGAAFLALARSLLVRRDVA